MRNNELYIPVGADHVSGLCFDLTRHINYVMHMLGIYELTIKLPERGRSSGRVLRRVKISQFGHMLMLADLSDEPLDGIEFPVNQRSNASAHLLSVEMFGSRSGLSGIFKEISFYIESLESVSPTLKKLAIAYLENKQI